MTHKNNKTHIYGKCVTYTYDNIWLGFIQPCLLQMIQACTFLFSAHEYINLWRHKGVYEGLGILVTNQHLEGTVSVQRGPGTLVASQQLTAKAMPVLSMSHGLCISCEAALCTGWICTTATQNSWCGSHCLSRKSDMPDHLPKNWSLLTKHFP